MLQISVRAFFSLLLLAAFPFVLQAADSGMEIDPSQSIIKMTLKDESTNGHGVYKVEQEWIIGTVCRNAYELIAFAAGKGNVILQDAVTVTKTTDNPLVYNVVLKDSNRTVQATLTFSGSVWNSESYVPFCQSAGQALQFTPPKTFNPSQGDPVHALLDFSGKTLVTELIRVSDWLTQDPVNPDAQEQAALILGAFGLKENSGWFWNTEEVCNHVAAHLAVARYLRGGTSLGTVGQLADCLQGLLTDTKTLCGKQLDQLASGTPSSDLVAWISAARLRNTRDWTAIADPVSACGLEQVEYFRAMSEAVDSDKAITWLQNSGLQDRIDWGRMVTQSQYSVDAGHAFAVPAIKSEIENMKALFPNKFGGEFHFSDLNELPEDVLQSSRIQVISSGMWAQHFQRHLLHAYEETYNFIANKWGLPADQVSQFKDQFNHDCSDLILYPYAKFLISLIKNDGADGEGCQAAFNRHPELVYPWVLDLKDPQFNNQILNWYSSPVPSGTAYCASERLEGISNSVVIPSGTIDKLYEIAPTSFGVAVRKLHKVGGKEPTTDQVQTVMGPLLKYYLPAIRMAFNSPSLSDQERLTMAENTAKIDPGWYVSVAYYEGRLGQLDKEADAYQNYHDLEPDKVAVSNDMQWLVNYYYDHNQKDKALSIATECATVYSYRGLETMLKLQERMGNIDQAISYGSNIKERYDDSGPLVSLYRRQIDKGNHNYQGTLDDLTKTHFPNGMKDVKISSFTGAPHFGVQLSEQTDAMTASGVTTQQIIVALDGTQVDNQDQYMFVRALSDSPYLHLIVWDGSQYKEITVNLPGRRFGVNLIDYVQK